MKPDCLKNGWVVVGFPMNELNIDEITETFVTPPNKYTSQYLLVFVL